MRLDKETRLIESELWRQELYKKMDEAYSTELMQDFFKRVEGRKQRFVNVDNEIQLIRQRVEKEGPFELEKGSNKLLWYFHKALIELCIITPIDYCKTLKKLKNELEGGIQK